MGTKRLLAVIVGLSVCYAVPAVPQDWTAALCFDGIDDYVDVPFYGQHDLFADFTLELRVRQDRVSAGCLLTKILTSGCGDSDSESYALHVDEEGHIVFRTLLPGFPCTVHDGIGSATLTVGYWSHVAVRFEAASGTKTVFINGQPVFSASGFGPLGYDGRPLYFGARLDRFGAVELPFAGCLSEIRLWAVARSQAEILGTMNASLQGNEADLVGLWRCDEGSGTTLHDATSHAAHGTIHGAVWTAIPARAASVSQVKSLY